MVLANSLKSESWKHCHRNTRALLRTSCTQTVAKPIGVEPQVWIKPFDDLDLIVWRILVHRATTYRRYSTKLYNMIRQIVTRVYIQCSLYGRNSLFPPVQPMRLIGRVSLQCTFLLVGICIFDSLTIRSNPTSRWLQRKHIERVSIQLFYTKN